jgi:hypothetical protein
MGRSARVLSPSMTMLDEARDVRRRPPRLVDELLERG